MHAYNQYYLVETIGVLVAQQQQHNITNIRNILQVFGFSQFLYNIMWMTGRTVLRIINNKKCVHSISSPCSIETLEQFYLKRNRNIQSGMWRFIIYTHTHQYCHRRANYIYYGWSTLPTNEIEDTVLCTACIKNKTKINIIFFSVHTYRIEYVYSGRQKGRNEFQNKKPIVNQHRICINDTASAVPERERFFINITYLYFVMGVCILWYYFRYRYVPRSPIYLLVFFVFLFSSTFFK